MKQNVKRTLSLLLASITLLMSFPMTAVAAEINKSFIYNCPDGTSIEYYLDENSNPYIIDDDEKVYLIIPSEGNRVTDPVIIAQLEKQAAKSEDKEGLPSSALHTRSTVFDFNSNSEFKESVTWNTERIIESPIFIPKKGNPYLVFNTDSVKPLLISTHITLYIRTYSVQEGKWEYTYFNHRSYTSGARFYLLPGVITKVQFFFNRYKEIKSLTYRVYPSNKGTIIFP